MIEEILALFFAQKAFSPKKYPPNFMRAYFNSIIEDDQIVTVERGGRIIAFQDYWKINEKARDLLYKMTRFETVGFALQGFYPRFKYGKHLYINFTVIHKKYRDKFITIELARKIAEKNPQAETVVYHRLDDKSRICKVRR